MKDLLTYVALTVIFAFLACGSVIAAGIDAFPLIGYGIFRLLVPLTLLFLIMVRINLRYAVPRLLLRGRLLPYCLCMLALSYLVPLAALGCEYLMRHRMGLPLRIQDYGSPWILADTFCNCILLFLLMLGAGFLSVYRKWREEARREEDFSARLGRYMAEVKERLNPGLIFAGLDRIIALTGSSVKEAAGEIARLCAYLRRQLYELPRPVAEPPREAAVAAGSFMATLLVSRRFRTWRHLIFQLILAVISFGVFFNAPDSPEFTPSRLGGFLSMYLLFNAVAYFNILCLFPRFRRSGDLRRYVLEILIFGMVLIIPIIVLQALTYEPGPYNRALPAPVVVASTIGSMLTVVLFIGGVSAVLLVQNWLTGQRRMTLLRAEYVRQEYAFLRKQINPHFLFNVLNNAGILSEEEPEESVKMLRELRRLLEFQLAETDRMYTPLGREIDFLGSYLSLEATRMEPFDFSIETEGDAGRELVPTLIFITFVENAVKHSSIVAGRRSVCVSFGSTPEGVDFTCRNTYREGPRAPRRDGGMGIDNTRRRLELLYGYRCRFSQYTDNDCFITKLFLPHDQLHNCR